MTCPSCPTPVLVALAACVSFLPAAVAQELRFQHHYIARDLPVNARGYGDYGLTALVDIDRDGDLDFVCGGRANQPSQLYWFEFQGFDRWVKHLVGVDYGSDVELAALDVDRDGGIDLACSGVWYRNPGRPREQPFERYVFAPGAGGAHDILAADMDGDGRPDIVMMGDPSTQLKELVWYRIPDDPRRLWERHYIGPSVHGAISPAGVADIDGDGDLDVVRADTWFENVDGKGLHWKAHENIPMGRKGPFGVCVRTVVTDVDGDGKQELVMCDADITDSKVAILKNVDGKGGQWSKREVPLSFPCGSLHSLAVADFNNDGRKDILVCEQEELLPAGRTNPRFVILENLGDQSAERIIFDGRLGGHELVVGDVDGDGDLDICSKAWGPLPWNAYQGKMHADCLENLLIKKSSAPPK